MFFIMNSIPAICVSCRDNIIIRLNSNNDIVSLDYKMMEGNCHQKLRDSSQHQNLNCKTRDTNIVIDFGEEGATPMLNAMPKTEQEKKVRTKSPKAFYQNIGIIFSQEYFYW